MSLTTVSLSGVVAGIPSELGERRMEIRVLRSMFVAGQPVQPGDIVEVDELVGRRLVDMGKAALGGGRETAVAPAAAEQAVAPTASTKKKPAKAEKE